LRGDEKKMMKFSRFLANAAVLTALAAASTAAALGPEPYPEGEVEFQTWQPEENVVVTGERILYEFKWNGIRAARVEIAVEEDPDAPDRVCVRGEGKIIGLPRFLYRAEDSVLSCMDKDTLKPDQYRITIKETLDRYDMSLSFDHQKGQANRVKKRPVGKSNKRFEFKNAYGPVSAAALIRSLPWKVGDKRGFEVIDGNDRWLLVMEAVQGATIETPAGTYRAVRLQPSVFDMPSVLGQETPEYWERLKVKDKAALSMMRSFSLWIAQSPPRPFLKMRTEVYFGHVDMVMSKIERPD